ncbi:pathogenesis associated protein [Aspergillus steynii IBT 23096]|uniref:Pathogenesis associated protein n=1 Tax=Aspergillus steynii IBT 23096 TaxID=1392250 RepID=A0A2I2G3I3_9EURO|nr:pathogenesis associated protein [Aspergillus steynii IBT 23096]PLB47438.1 pathogenesis associated protein [Aspergillus steynii IBT 23096]
MVDLHSLPAGSRPENAIRNNGPHDLVLERYKLRELAEGWPAYRDACEWENLRSIFHPDAYIYTTWTGRTFYQDFIASSQKGMDNGAFIMHRVHGSTTDITPDGTRAVTKMKATITQRFVIEGCEVDAEADCRFCFFWEKMSESGEWRARFVRHWYEKDKLIPANPGKVPVLDEELLEQYPSGYRYLAYCQEKTMGVKVLLDMPGPRRDGDSINGQKHDMLYWQCKKWLDGEVVEI